jgi:hypothetical protein
MEIANMNQGLPAIALPHAAVARSAHSDNSFQITPTKTRTTVLNAARRQAGLSAIALLSVCLLQAMRADMPMSPPAGGSMVNMPPASTPAMKGGMKDKMDDTMDGMTGMTDEQRQSVLGNMPAMTAPQATSTQPSASGKPAMAPMKGM